MPNLTSEAVRTYTIKDFAKDCAGKILPPDRSRYTYWDGQTIDGWDYLGAGGSRMTFTRPGSKYVLKIPVSKMGIRCNEEEANAFRADKRRLARCRMIVLSGLKCLLMEKLDVSDIYNRLGREAPSWTCHMDGLQIGYNRKKELVAYDYAYDLLPVRD